MGKPLKYMAINGISISRGGSLRDLVVNFKYSFIFNGVFETQKSTRNRQINDEMRQKNACASRVYYNGIHHYRALREIYFPLRRAGAVLS